MRHSLGRAIGARRTQGGAGACQSTARPAEHPETVFGDGADGDGPGARRGAAGAHHPGVGGASAAQLGCRHARHRIGIVHRRGGDRPESGVAVDGARIWGPCGGTRRPPGRLGGGVRRPEQHRPGSAVCADAG
eukprot:ctg_1223.g391